MFTHRTLLPPTQKPARYIAIGASSLVKKLYLSWNKNGAGEGSRTLVLSLEGCCTTVVLHPHRVSDPPDCVHCSKKDIKKAPFRSYHNGGKGWIRTTVLRRGQIYSLLPLTTRPPFHIHKNNLICSTKSMNNMQGKLNIVKHKKISYNLFQ